MFHLWTEVQRATLGSFRVTLQHLRMFGLNQMFQLRPEVQRTSLGSIQLLSLHPLKNDWRNRRLFQIRTAVHRESLDSLRYIFLGMPNASTWYIRMTGGDESFNFNNRHAPIILCLRNILMGITDGRECWQLRTAVSANATQQFSFPTKNLHRDDWQNRTFQLRTLFQQAQLDNNRSPSKGRLTEPNVSTSNPRSFNKCHSPIFVFLPSWHIRLSELSVNVSSILKWFTSFSSAFLLL